MINNLMNQGQELSINPSEAIEMQSNCIDRFGFPKILAAAELQEFSPNTIRAVMQINGIYVWPTIELWDWLIKNIDVSETLEIGAGNGMIAGAMDMIATDSFLQSKRFRPKDDRERKIQSLMMAAYEKADIPCVQYGANVEQLDAQAAIVKYKPKVVLGQYITHRWQGKGEGNQLGVNEDWILNRKYVQKYIMVGNLKVHSQKLILKRPHEEIKLDGLIVRASEPSLNRIFIWEK